MGCVNGKWVWREESGMGREEEEERKKKEKKKRKRASLARKRQDTNMGPQYEYIYKNAIVTLFP